MAENKNRTFSMTEASRNFSRIARIATENGNVIISRNNEPRYMVIDIVENPVFELTDDEKIDVAAKRILTRHKRAFTELAK